MSLPLLSTVAVVNLIGSCWYVQKLKLPCTMSEPWSTLPNIVYSDWQVLRQRFYPTLQPVLLTWETKNWILNLCMQRTAHCSTELSKVYGCCFCTYKRAYNSILMSFLHHNWVRRFLTAKQIPVMGLLLCNMFRFKQWSMVQAAKC